MALNLSFKDLIISAVGALVPTLASFSFTAMLGLLTPASEIRVLPTLFDQKSFYIEVENHGSSSMGSFSFTIQQAQMIKVLAQNKYADIKIENQFGNYLITINKAEPQVRTIILFGGEKPLDAAEIHFVDLPFGATLVQSSGYEALNFSRKFWLPILMQMFIFFILFAASNAVRKQAQKTLSEARGNVEKLGDQLEKLKSKTDTKADALGKSILEIRNANQKYRKFTHDGFIKKSKTKIVFGERWCRPV